MNKSLYALLLIALVCSTSSCGLYHRISGRKTAVDSSLVTVRDSVFSTVDTTGLLKDSAVVVTPLRQNDSALLTALLPLWNSQMQWNTFSGKAKVHYEGSGESQDFTANIRMEKGRTVWVSVTALLGIEFARVLITPDTIQILNRLQKEVRILPFSESSKILPVHADFASLQSLIIGDVLQTGHQPTEVADTAAAFILSHISSGFTQSLQFEKSDTALRFQAISSGDAFLLCEYANREKQGIRSFAKNRNITMNDKGEPYQMSLEFSTASFDESVALPFAIPEKYQRK